MAYLVSEPPFKPVSRNLGAARHTCYRNSRRAPLQNSMTSLRACASTSQMLVLEEASSLCGPADDSHCPILYTHMLCPYAQRALLALLAKGCAFRAVHVDLSARPAWYTHLNSLVPAVSFCGSVYTESLDIIRWVAAELPGSPLIPKGAEDAVAAQLQALDGFVSAGLGLLAGDGRSWAIGTKHTKRQLERFRAELSALDCQLSASGGPFLNGGALSLADIAYLPFAERFAIAMPEFCGLDIWDTLALRAWLAAAAQHTACRAASPNPALLLQAFREHRSLDFFDYTSYAARQLHPHLLLQ